MIKQELLPDEAQDMGTQLARSGIFKAKTFMGFFNSGKDIHDFWTSVYSWKFKGGILSNPRQMLPSLQRSDRAAIEQNDLFMNPNVDNPIDKKTNDTLTLFLYLHVRVQAPREPRRHTPGHV